VCLEDPSLGELDSEACPCDKPPAPCQIHCFSSLEAIALLASLELSLLPVIILRVDPSKELSKVLKQQGILLQNSSCSNKENMSCG
jgi:hypothetical protein